MRSWHIRDEDFSIDEIVDTLIQNVLGFQQLVISLLPFAPCRLLMIQSSELLEILWLRG